MKCLASEAGDSTAQLGHGTLGSHLLVRLRDPDLANSHAGAWRRHTARLGCGPD